MDNSSLLSGRFGRLILVGGVLFLTLFASDVSADDTVFVPALDHESLAAAMHRIHPCPIPHEGEVLSQLMADNPEYVGRDGQFALRNKEIKVSPSFVDSGKTCGNVAKTPPAIVTPAVPTPVLTPAAAPPVAPVASEQIGKAEKEAEKETEKAEPKNVITLGSFVEFSKVDARDYAGDAATLTSQPEYGFFVGYERWLGSQVAIGMTYRFAKSQFQDIDTFRLSEQSTTLQSAEANTTFKLTEATLLHLDLGAAQIDHVTFPDPLSVYVEHKWAPRIKLMLTQEFAAVSGFAFGGGISTSLYLPAGGSADTSLAAGALLFVERHLTEALTAELGVGGAFQRQGYEDSTDSAASYGADLGLGFHF